MDHLRRTRWSQEQRLAFAADRLFWDGALRREDLIARFDLSPAQATADLSQLRRRLGPGIAYDISRRAYVPTPALSAPPTGASGLLAELRLIAEGILPAEAGRLATPPPVEIPGQLARAVPEAVLREVLAAIRGTGALEADYVSFQRPEAARRRLSPHALVFDGFRWHARAFDAGDGRFKDFLLARLSRAVPAGAADAPADADDDWIRRTVLRIGPHPGLTPHQRRVVEQDYDMKDGVLQLSVRQAVLFYVLRRLGLTQGHRGRPAHEQHIVLLDDPAP